MVAQTTPDEAIHKSGHRILCYDGSNYSKSFCLLRQLIPHTNLISSPNIQWVCFYVICYATSHKQLRQAFVI
jgi:hypothetical protein